MPQHPSDTAALADPEAEPLCPDWVFLNNSNVHVAKNRGWFTHYVPFISTIGHILGSVETEVHGIGTVALPVKRKPNGSGVGAHSSLWLVDVLHIPSITCNIIGNPILDDYEVITSFGQDSKGGIFGPNGKKLAYFISSSSLFQVKLSGPPVGPQVGPTVFRDGKLHYINAYWIDSERQRWEAYKEDMTSGRAPYTAEEKKWLKKHYKDEFHFLLSYGLKIYNDEDREEGRAIARGLMQHDE